MGALFVGAVVTKSMATLGDNVGPLELIIALGCVVTTSDIVGPWDWVAAVGSAEGPVERGTLVGYVVVSTGLID